jgi:hypothetical protein
MNQSWVRRGAFIVILATCTILVTELKYSFTALLQIQFPKAVLKETPKCNYDVYKVTKSLLSCSKNINTECACL